VILTKYIIFDFDGTIADTLTLVEEIGNNILKPYGMRINTEETKQIGLQRAIIKSKFPKWEIPKAMSELKKQLNRRLAAEVNLFPDMEHVLRELKKSYSLGIVSSNSGENIKMFLNRHNVLDLFSFIHSDSSLFGKHLVLTRLCKINHIELKDIVYIGDEDRDIQATKKLGIPIIAVTWGYNTIDNLQKENPPFLANNPKDLLEIIPTVI
jgi:HAD superfamily hydrolase (TIGR01549 family)